MLIVSHPTGNANSKAAVTSLHKAGLLSRFHTAIATFPGSLLYKMMAVGPLKEIRRRSFDNKIRPLTSIWPWREAGRILALKAGLTSLTKHENGPLSVDSVYHSMDRKIASTLKRERNLKIKGVYAYEDGALSSFQCAKKLNLECFYDLPIGYWRAARRLLEVERSKHPAWASTLTGFKDSDAKLARKDNELRLADRILVASSFTAETLMDFPDSLAPISVIPYGFPPVVDGREYSTGHHRPLKLLFVGGLSQRKGIAQLFEAVNNIRDYIELTVIGQKTGHPCPILDTALAKHTWIPSLPHNEILKQMRVHDALVFPSLFEGFGLVITEAMSQGTPVITTNRTAGPDLIDHNRNGWLVEAGSSQALQLAIEKLINRPGLIEKAGRAALETARLRPWEVYGQELAKIIQKHLVK